MHKHQNCITPKEQATKLLSFSNPEANPIGVTGKLNQQRRIQFAFGRNRYAIANDLATE